MIVVSQSVHVEAPVETVFALMADPAQRTRLNPLVSAPSAEIEGGGEMCVGSTCRFRFCLHGRAVEYRSRVEEFDPPHRIVLSSDSAIPFQVCIETTPEGTGTRLTQTERFEPTDAMLEQALPDRAGGAAVKLAWKLYLFFDTDQALELRTRQEQLLVQRLEANMGQWLSAVKRHLEQAT